MSILTQIEKSALSRSRAKIKALLSFIIVSVILNICLMVRLDSALEPKIIDVTGNDGMNDVFIQHTDTTEYFNIPDSMLNKLYHNVNLITRADTSLD